MANVRLNSSDPVILDGTEQIPVVKNVDGVEIDGTATTQEIANLAAAGASSPGVEVTDSRTLTPADAGRFIRANHATTPIVLTVPASASAFPADAEIHVRWRGAAAVSIAGATVTHPGSQTKALRERYSVVTLKREGVTDAWALFGDLGDMP